MLFPQERSEALPPRAKQSDALPPRAKQSDAIPLRAKLLTKWARSGTF